MPRPTNFALAALSAGVSAAPAVLGQSKTLSYGELRAGVAAFAQELSAAGMAPGERVVLLADNNLFSFCAYLGIMAAGGVVVPLSPVSLAKSLDYQIEATEARFGFVQWKYYKRWAELGRAARLARVWFDEAKAKELPGNVALAPAISGELAAAELPAPAGDCSDELAAIIFTSGSTGTPRGVKVSHGNLAANTCSIVEYLGLGPADRALLVLPLYYCYGASVLHTHLWVGGSVALTKGFIFPEKVLDELCETEASGFYGVPSTFQVLLRRTTLKQRTFPRLRYFAQAGGRLPNAFLQELRGALPQVRFFTMYGQTEATARLSYLPPERLVDKLGSIGRGIPGVELRVLRADGTPVSPGEVGEVVAAGGNITQGYWRDEEETAKHFKEGRLWTGDLATVDQEGFIFIRDRARDFIKVSGVRVSSKEVEDVIAEVDQVVEVAVVGVPDELSGEAIAAFVVPVPGGSLEEGELLRYCKRRLPSEKQPRYVVLEKSLPKNEAGKVLKAQIKAKAQERLGLDAA